MEITIKGLQCHYEQVGQGKDVLLLHGWGGSVDSWIPVTNYLAPQCRVTVLDFPGHGTSGEPGDEGWSVDEYADFTEEFIEKLGLAGCDVVAHSFGGRVALLLGARRPELFGKMLLTGAAGLLPKRSAGYKVKQFFVKVVKGILGILPGGKKLRENFAGFFGSEDYRALKPSMRATFVKVVNQDLDACLDGIRSETLLVWGRNDTATPLWMGQEMEKRIKGSAFIVLEGAGHFAYLEKCDQFLRILSAFFFPQEK